MAMNPILPAALVMLASLLATAQDTPSSPATPAPAPAPATPATTPEPTPVRNPGPPPIVRLEVESETAATPPAILPPLTQTELGWSSDGVGLRTRPDSIRTNRATRARGALPKAARPARRTFGGFVASFANLFNPLAPVQPAEEMPPQHWYDGQPNVAPMPRGFRDERGHEPSALLFSTPLGRDPDPEPAPPAAPGLRAAPVPPP